MGTNYYAEYNRCRCCGRYDSAHIGKSRRIVQIYPNGLPGAPETIIESFNDWRRFLDHPDVTVMTEYGERVADSSFELHQWLDGWKRHESVAHWEREDAYAAVYQRHGNRLDLDGYHICRSEFS